MWGVNGACGVMASILGVMGSMWLGIHVNLLRRRPCTRCWHADASIWRPRGSGGNHPCWTASAISSAISRFTASATSRPRVVSLLLLPIYTQYLTPSDYGVIAMLLTIEAVAKVLFRWGVDTAFMRLYYDCADQTGAATAGQHDLLLSPGVNGPAHRRLPRRELLEYPCSLDSAHEAILIALVIGNTFVVGLYFIPFQVLRIEEQSKQFIALVFTRSARPSFCVWFWSSVPAWASWALSWPTSW